MDFLEKVKKTVASVAKVSSRESKKLYAITKIKLEISEKQNKIKSLYKEIGHDAYRAHRAGKNIVRRIRSKLEEIDAIRESIDVLRNKIEIIKNANEFDMEDVAIDVDDEIYDEEFDAEIVDEEAVEEDTEELETEPIEPIQ